MPQNDDAQRPARPRANTTFNAFNWRRGKIPTSVETAAPSAELTQPLPLETLIEALTPPAVPSLAYARALAHTLSTVTPPPRFAILSPVLANLCGANAPIAFQAAGYDILASYWDNCGSAVLTTADRLSCFSLFLDLSVSWLTELWEPRFKALVALIRSGTETVGIEAQLLKILRTWIEGAFSGLTVPDPSISPSPAHTEERLERQRAVESMTALLMSLVGRAEFVSRISETDTSTVLQLFGNLIDSALDVSSEHSGALSSPISEITLVSPISTSRIPMRHHRHQSSLSIPQVPAVKPAADLAVEIYLNYLAIRLKAVAPVHLKTILPHLFRALAFYASPLPRLSLTPSDIHENPLEMRIMEVLDSLVTGPYSASCTVMLKYHLFPEEKGVQEAARTSLGAIRTLRASIRRVLIVHLARSYISRTTSMNYTPSGAPGQIVIERDLLERAWAKDDAATWDLNRFRSVLCRAVRQWIEFDQTGSAMCSTANHPCEMILTEITGILKDITQAFDETGDELDYEEVEAIGDILRELTAFVRLQKTPGGAPIRIALSQMEVPTNFLSMLSALLAQDLLVTPLHSVLPTVILSIAEHVSDTDTAQLLCAMLERQSFSPTSPMWLDNWKTVLAIPDLFSIHRARTRQVAVDILLSVWEFVKDIAAYRHPLATLVFGFWREQAVDLKEDHTSIIIWRILGDEIVLHSVERLEETTTESDEEDPVDIAGQIVDFLTLIASESHDDELEVTGDTTLPSPSLHMPSTVGSPILSRMTSEYPSPIKEKETTIPSVMSLLSSLTSGHSSRSHSQPPHSHDQPTAPESPMAHPPEQPSIPKAVGAVVALVSAFSQLAFTSLAVYESRLELATRLFKTLVSLLGATTSTKARLAILQFFMRLRVDRDHQLYFASSDYDKEGITAALASQIGRGDKSMSAVDLHTSEEMDLRRARAREPRNGRRLSRGRGGQPSASESSRSRSRATSRAVPTSLRKQLKPLEPLWALPESLPFLISAEADTPSERLSSYDPDGPENKIVLPLSLYLAQLVSIIRSGKDWELLSYVLCHLPAQLSNKHLFCGPKSKVVLNDLLTTLCSEILDGRVAASVERWPENVFPRDAQGLAYHTLTILVSYKRCFEKNIHLLHTLVEVFLAGLSGSPHTIKCCLNALSLSAFELPVSTTKYMSRILEKLSQIMSNPAMAVHIIDFLAIVGSQPALHSNFTEADYKMVFGVALQYLQHHNRPEASLTISWALSQHVCIMSYYIVYLWFLAVKLPDRPRHIKYITRQLLLANEGRQEVDEPTEVCFDWLARYTYASADPRPANSMLSDIIMSPLPSEASSQPAIAEKTWILGNTVVTIRTLAKRGWVEVISRRASGLTKFLCRAENVPMVTAGDVDPDLLSVAATLTMDRGSGSEASSASISGTSEEIKHTAENSEDSEPPDPITGYVWSGTAPSQRRKEVSIDPSYFALQLSSYPDSRPSTIGRIVADSSRVPAFFRALDRMPVIDTHKVGILYVAPGQSDEKDILGNTHGSPAYTRFLEGLGRLIDLRGQVDVYAGGLDPDEDGEYAYAWWDDIGQILYHTATLMPSGDEDKYTNKKRHIGNDFVRIVWNDSGQPYRFDTLSTQFQFVNIVIEPHSRGAIAAFSHNIHENEYFKLTLQRAPGMPEFTPVGEFKLVSAETLPLLVRQLSLLTDWFVAVYQHTQNDTAQVEMTTNWRSRLQAIKRFRSQLAVPTVPERLEGILGQESFRDFTTAF